MSDLPKIDAHQHFWHPARGDYDWMPPDNPVLSRPYGPADLYPAKEHLGIDGTVLVQAAASTEETAYMLGVADATPWVKGVVGWIDFENPSHISHLERFAAHPKFLGVRPMIQDIPDIDWMLRRDIQWAFDAITDMDLTFDALGFPEHLNNFLIIAKRYSKMRFVIDHCMKPKIREQMSGRDAFTDWAKKMSELGEKTRASVKLSGIVTEAADGWTLEDLRPFTDHVISAFGAERVMWGSDWPVCRLQSEYEEWHGMAEALTAHLSQAERADIFGGTASRFYRLS